MDTFVAVLYVQWVTKQGARVVTFLDVCYVTLVEFIFDRELRDVRKDSIRACAVNPNFHTNI